MNELPHITKSEWLVMNQLWAQSPLTAAEIVEKIQTEKNLAVTTVKTLLRRLVAKNAVGFTVDTHNAKLYYYHPLVKEEDCVEKESQHFLSLYYKDNVEKLLAAFLDKSELSDKELKDLEKLLEERRRQKHDG